MVDAYAHAYMALLYTEWTLLKEKNAKKPRNNILRQLEEARTERRGKLSRTLHLLFADRKEETDFSMILAGPADDARKLIERGEPLPPFP
jgi:hypothetical protein